MAPKSVRHYAAMFAGTTPLLKVFVAPGVAPSTNIPVPGLFLDDIIQSVIQFAAGVPSLVAATITSKGNIQTLASTTGNTLIVSWYTIH